MNRKTERRMEEIENAGRDAARAGKDRFDCPHYAYSKEAEYWMQGYDAGRRAA